jgi:dTDP-4-amino-4,6-dideoxygalactose transaminase
MSVSQANVKKSAAPSGVPLLDLKAQYAPLRDEIEAAIREVCDSQYFVMGPKVTELEEKIAKYSHAGFGIGVSSGTDALLVALMALDVGPLDEVITSTFSFFATGGVVSRLRARPVFCDIDPETYNLDPTSVRRFLETECKNGPDGLVNKKTGGRVRVLIPVHLFGQMADMQALMAIAKEYDLRVIEDAAQAIGSEDADGRRAGSIGDIGCFSFFPSKNLGAFGDGGMCVANDAELAAKLGVLRLHGGKPKYYHAMIGGNFRLDAIQAAILLVKLKYLDDWSAGRQANAARYDAMFAEQAPHIGTPTVRKGVRHIYNQYTLRIADREGLRAHLTQKGVGTEIYYPVPLHLQKCFASLGYKAGDCPVAEAAANSVLAIPIYPELNVEQQQYVVDACAAFGAR